MSQSVNSNLIIGGIDAHSLLAHSRLISITRRLIVVGERNNTRANTEDHCRVNLTVSILVEVVAANVLHQHGNVASLLFHHVDVLNEALTQDFRPSRLLVLCHVDDVRSFQVQKSCFFVNDQQRTHQTSIVCGYEQFTFPNISCYPDLMNHASNRHLTPLLSQRVREVVGIVGHAHPDTVHEDLAKSRAGTDSWRCQLFELFHTSSLKQLDYDLRCATDRDVGHEGKILDQTARLALGSLCWANDTPLCVVQLSRLCNFPLLADRCVGSSQMRESGCKC
mmetsp:Transcript_21736/g.71902  ORF Transcript_21736/g.71902 Transcript_21736/m.71902 type:complete len:279 (+) Transcript_21736:1366-2202(+)